MKHDLLLMLNESENPLAIPEAVVTSTLVSASITSIGTGTGMAGPIINVRLIPLSMISTARLHLAFRASPQAG